LAIDYEAAPPVLLVVKSNEDAATANARQTERFSPAITKFPAWPTTCLSVHMWFSAWPSANRSIAWHSLGRKCLWT